MICENCGSSHDGSYGSGRFCSVKCSRGFSTKAKRKEINQKVGKSLTKKPYKRTCPGCKVGFETKIKRQKYCSLECVRKYASNTPEVKEKLRQSQLKLVKEGKHIGWKSRTKKPSYPEQYFINLFENEHISGWERDKKEGPYFIDFAFLEKKVALEVDGKQHWEDQDRAERDKQKDDLLKKNGWKVFRIKWYNPINEKNKNKLYPQIEEFKKII